MVKGIGRLVSIILLVACTPRTIGPDGPQWAHGDTVLEFYLGDKAHRPFPPLPPHVNVSPTELMFYCEWATIKDCNPRTITVTNNTKEPVMIFDAFTALNSNSWSSDDSFSVLHFEETELYPGEEMKFEVGFAYTSVGSSATLWILTTFSAQPDLQVKLSGKVFWY